MIRVRLVLQVLWVYNKTHAALIEYFYDIILYKVG